MHFIGMGIIVTARARVLLEVFVSVIVSGATAAIIVKCSSEDKVSQVTRTTSADQPILPSSTPGLTQPSPPSPSPMTSPPSNLAPQIGDDVTAVTSAGLEEGGAPIAIDDAGELDALPAAELANVADANASFAEEAELAGAAGADAGAAATTSIDSYSYRGPSFSAGAGRFLTEPPLWGASAFVSNPEAGAGTFLTEAPSWGASAMTPNPEAGAGAFTTERSSTAADYSLLYIPIFPFIPIPIPAPAPASR